MELGMRMRKGRGERELETGNVEFIAMSVWAVWLVGGGMRGCCALPTVIWGHLALIDI